MGIMEMEIFQLWSIEVVIAGLDIRVMPSVHIVGSTVRTALARVQVHFQRLSFHALRFWSGRCTVSAV